MKRLALAACENAKAANWQVQIIAYVTDDETGSTVYSAEALKFNSVLLFTNNND